MSRTKKIMRGMRRPRSRKVLSFLTASTLSTACELTTTEATVMSALTSAGMSGFACTAATKASVVSVAVSEPTSAWMSTNAFPVPPGAGPIWTVAVTFPDVVVRPSTASKEEPGFPDVKLACTCSLQLVTVHNRLHWASRIADSSFVLVGSVTNGVMFATVMDKTWRTYNRLGASPLGRLVLMGRLLHLVLLLLVLLLELLLLLLEGGPICRSSMSLGSVPQLPSWAAHSPTSGGPRAWAASNKVDAYMRKRAAMATRCEIKLYARTICVWGLGLV